MFSKFNVSPYLAKGTVSFRFYQSPSSFYWQPCLGLNKWRPSKIHWSFCDGQTMRCTKFTSLLKSERRLHSNFNQHIYCTYITFLHFGFTRVAVYLISPRNKKERKNTCENTATFLLRLHILIPVKRFAFILTSQQQLLLHNDQYTLTPGWPL